MASRPTRERVRVDRLVFKCESGKMGYDTRAQAFDACEAGMLAGRVWPGCHLMPYRCDQCSGWHVRNEQIANVPPHDASKHTRRGCRTDDPR